MQGTSNTTTTSSISPPVSASTSGLDRAETQSVTDDVPDVPIPVSEFPNMYSYEEVGGGGKTTDIPLQSLGVSGGVFVNDDEVKVPDDDDNDIDGGGDTGELSSPKTVLIPGSPESDVVREVYGTTDRDALTPDVVVVSKQQTIV